MLRAWTDRRAGGRSSAWPRPAWPGPFGLQRRRRVAGARPNAATARAWRNPVPENSLPGTSDWVIRHLGAEHEIEGYAGKASVLPGEPLPLFVSTTARSFTVTAYRLGWYQGHGARQLWKSKTVRGGAQRAATVSAGTSTVSTDWDPVLHVPTDDWPAGAYLLKLTAESGAQRYVPVTVRSPSCAGKVVLKACVPTWQAYNLWGGYDLYKGPNGAYADRSLVVSLDRPYGDNGANMFLTYERNAVKLAEYLTTEPGGLDLAYVTSMDIDADPRLLDGASALISLGHDEYWTPAERANVTAARDKGVNLAFLGANAMFRRTRLQASALGEAREVVCYKTAYHADPQYAKDPPRSPATGATRRTPDPESTLIGTIYEGYPVDAPFVVSSAYSWVYQGTGVPRGRQLPAPGRRRVRPGRPRLPAAAPHRGALPLPADLRRARPASATPPTTPTPAAPASTTAARCAGWRRSTATSRTASAAPPRRSSARSPPTCCAPSPTAPPRTSTRRATTWPRSTSRTAARSARATSSNPQIKTIIIIPNGCR